MSLDGHKWSSITENPRPRLYFSSALVDEKIFLFGGCTNNGKSVASVDSYNFITKQWHSVKDMSEPKAAPTVHRVDNKLYLFGGVGSDSKATDCVEYLDLGAEQWVSVKSLPQRLQGVAVQQRGDKLILAGGMTPEMQGTFHLYCFDPSRGTLQPLPAMPTKRAKCGSFLINDKLYVVGGIDGRTPITVIEMFDFRAFRWTDLAFRKTPPRIFESYVKLSETQIGCLGGLQKDMTMGFSDAVDIYNIESDTWSAGASIPDARGEFACAWYRDNVVVAGGFGNGGRPINSAAAYNPETDAWTSLPSMKVIHASCGCVSDESRFAVIGGMSSGNTGCSPVVEVLADENYEV